MCLKRWAVAALVCAGAPSPGGAAQDRDATLQAQQRNAPVRPFNGQAAQQVVIPLDDTGVRDLDYLNPRNPPYVFGEVEKAVQQCLGPGASVSAATDDVLKALRMWALGVSEVRGTRTPPRSLEGCAAPYGTLRIEFPNTTSDRDIRVVLHVPLGRFARWFVEKERGQAPPGPQDLDGAEESTADRLLRTEACVPADNAPMCDYTFNILRGGAALVDVADLVWLTGLGSDPAKKLPGLFFDVSFLRDNETPANARGSFTLVPLTRLLEGPSATKWSATSSLKGTRDPALGTDALEIPITADAPYDGAQRDHFPAQSRLILEQNLGNRADASVELTFKNGDFGGKDAQPAVAASSYRVNVYSRRGVRIQLGKTEFAKPTSGIAVNEAGEGFRLSYRKVSVSHVSKREGKDTVPNDRDVDNTVWIVQLSSVRTPPGFGPFRAYSFAAVLGRDRDPLTDHRYRTVGGDATFRQFGWRGNLAGYRSWTKPLVPGGMERRGTSAFLSLNRSWIDQGFTDAKGKPRHAVGLTAGYGTGDRLSTGKDEGYLGETARFAPDMLFLASLAKRIKTDGQGTLGEGLSNKRYAGIAYTNSLFSPLEWVAKAVGAADDIRAQSTLVQWHVYRLNEPVRGSRDAGHEIDVKAFIETPPGVIVELSAARFFPGEAVQALFKRKPWSILGSITVKL